MRLSRKELESKILLLCSKDFNKTEAELNDIQDQLYEKWNIPRQITNDIITLRSKYLSDKDIIVLFGLASYFHIESFYFTDEEIKEYSDTKYVEDKVTFPLRFKQFVEVDPQHRLVIMDGKLLMQLFNMGKIQYNINNQRAVKKHLAGGVDYFSYDINRRSVSEIANLFLLDKFISNTITLNASDEDIIEFDKRTQELVIEDFDHFDIIDGFHRLLGLMTALQKNPDLEIKMEVRIVRFNETRIKEFIWQENKRNVIKKTEAPVKPGELYSEIFTIMKNSGELDFIFNRGIIIIKNANLTSLLKMLYSKVNRKEMVEIAKLLTRKFVEYKDEFNEPVAVPMLTILFAAASIDMPYEKFLEKKDEALAVCGNSYYEPQRRVLTRVTKILKGE